MRETGVVAKKLSTERAAEYEGLARKVLGKVKNRLALGDIPFLRHRVLLEDGTIIEVGTNHGQDWFRINPPEVEDEGVSDGEVRLETGIHRTPGASLNPLGGYDRVSAQSGKLYYEQPQIDALSATPEYLDVLQFALNSSGGYAGFIGTEVRGYTPGMASTSFDADSALSYYSGNYASISGKARHVLQCLAGSNASYSGLAPLLNEPPTDNESYAIWSGADFGTYFVLKITKTGVSIAPLSLTPEGEIVKSYAEDPTGGNMSWPVTKSGAATTSNKIESYLVSQLRLNNDFVDIHTFSTAVEGDAIYYGWNFKDDTSAGTLVTHESVASGTTKLYVRSRRYTLTLTASTYNDQQPITPFNSPVSVSLTKSEEVDWTPEGTDVVWKPSPSTGVMTYHYWFGCDITTDYASLIEADAPVYAFYDANGSLVQLRHEREVLTSQSYGDILNARDAALRGYDARSCALASVDYDFEEYVDGSKKRFYTTGGGSGDVNQGRLDAHYNITTGGNIGYKFFEKINATLLQTYRRKVDIFYSTGSYRTGPPESWFHWCANPTEYTHTTPERCTISPSIYDLDIACGEYLVDSFSMSMTASSSAHAAVLPWHDSCAVQMAVRKITGGTRDGSTFIKRGPIGIAQYNCDTGALIVPMQYIKYPFGYHDAGAPTIREYDLFSGVPDPCEVTPSDQIILSEYTGSGTFYEIYHVHIGRHGGQEVEHIYTEDDTSQLGVYFTFGGGGFFDPFICGPSAYPYFDYKLLSMSGFFANNMWSGTFLDFQGPQIELKSDFALVDPTDLYHPDVLQYTPYMTGWT